MISAEHPIAGRPKLRDYIVTWAVQVILVRSGKTRGLHSELKRLEALDWANGFAVARSCLPRTPPRWSLVLEEPKLTTLQPMALMADS